MKAGFIATQRPSEGDPDTEQKRRGRDPAQIFEEDTESFDTRSTHPVVTPLLSSARV